MNTRAGILADARERIAAHPIRSDPGFKEAQMGFKETQMVRRR